MQTRVVLALALALVWCGPALSQQIQPVVLVADYQVRFGKEEEFLTLVKEVGEAAFGKLMAEGVVRAWGVDVPLLHAEGAPTHSIWWTVNDMGGVEKTQAAIQEHIATLEAEHKKAAEGARGKRQPATKSLAERFQETTDLSKHKDWPFRELIVGHGRAPHPAGALPYFWISLVRVLPGKAVEYRQLWEKYTKPVYDKLVADAAILGYEFGTEEARTTDAFSHFVSVSLPDLAAREKVRAAFAAANQARSEETRRQITQSFLGVTDPTASRAFILRSVIFKVAESRK